MFADKFSNKVLILDTLSRVLKLVDRLLIYFFTLTFIRLLALFLRFLNFISTLGVRQIGLNKFTLLGSNISVLKLYIRVEYLSVYY